jgi:peptide/nickel transport system permease protein
MTLVYAKSTAPGVRHRSQWHYGLIIVLAYYAAALCADFLAPYDYRAQVRQEPFAPSTTIHFRDPQGGWHWRPFIYAQRLRDPLTRSYGEDTQRAYPLELFAPGYAYNFFGVWQTNRHLFSVRRSGLEETPRLHLLGTDEVGRDRWSRLLVAARFSLLTGPLGTLCAGLLGVLLGCVAGYAGGWIEAALMRLTDAVLALPSLVLILAARAAFPLELPTARAALLLVGIFTVLGWAEMARLARGLVLELRQREFVLAAISLGASPVRVLWRHLLPNAARPLLVQLLLLLPVFLLAETSLSFLGVGLQEPEASWGGMLAAAADVSLLQQAQAWVLLAPAWAIMGFVLGVRLLAGGLSATTREQ